MTIMSPEKVLTKYIFTTDDTVEPVVDFLLKSSEVFNPIFISITKKGHYCILSYKKIESLESISVMLTDDMLGEREHKCIMFSNDNDAIKTVLDGMGYAIPVGLDNPLILNHDTKISLAKCIRALHTL